MVRDGSHLAFILHAPAVPGSWHDPASGIRRTLALHL
jgi:hypothetical protein